MGPCGSSRSSIKQLHEFVHISRLLESARPSIKRVYGIVRTSLSSAYNSNPLGIRLIRVSRFMLYSECNLYRRCPMLSLDRLPYSARISQASSQSIEMEHGAERKIDPTSFARPRFLCFEPNVVEQSHDLFAIPLSTMKISQKRYSSIQAILQTLPMPNSCSPLGVVPSPKFCEATTSTVTSLPSTTLDS